MQMPMLTLAVLDFRNMIRGILPKKTARYSVFGIAALSSMLLSLAIISLVLTNPDASKNLVKVNMLAGMLLSMTSFALILVTFMASQDIENPNQLKIALLSPWSETYQIIPRILALIFLAVIPFIVMITPFFLPVLFKDFFSALYLILMIACGLIYSVLLSILLISVLVKFFGRQKGSRLSVMLSAMLIPFSGFLFQKLLSLKISTDSVGIFLLVSFLLIPILISFIIKQYRNALLNSSDLLFSREPVWGQYPWSRFFWRSRAPWIILSFPILSIITLISPDGKSLIWKSFAIFFSCVAIPYIINELIEWNRNNPVLWDTSPNKIEAMKQLVLYQFIPILIISLISIFALGVVFNKLNWAIFTTCLLPLQFGILNFRYGKSVTIILTSFSVLFIYFSPIFS
jgi:hypothetical protein